MARAGDDQRRSRAPLILPPAEVSEATLVHPPAARVFSARSRQNDPSHAARDRRVFIRGRRKARDRPRRCPAPDRTGPIWRSSAAVHSVMSAGRRSCTSVRSDDRMLGFLNRHELSECRPLRNLVLPNGFRVRFEDAEHFCRALACRRRADARVYCVSLPACICCSCWRARVKVDTVDVEAVRQRWLIRTIVVASRTTARVVAIKCR